MTSYFKAMLFWIGSPGSVIYWGWLLTYTVLGFVFALFQQRAKTGEISLKEAFRFCYSKEIWLSRSAIADYCIFIINILVLTTAVNIWVMHGTPDRFAQNKIHLWMSGLFSAGGVNIPIASHSVAASLAYSFLLLAFGDLGYTLMHLLYHRVPWLWELHKVHHSATTLNIFTFHRTHILQQILDPLSWGIGAGIFVWATGAAFGAVPSVVTVMGFNVFLTATHLFHNFSHSQYPISFGRFSYLLRSPLMHHIHHSTNPKHFDKNLCFAFPFWDWMLGTLYIPEPDEQLAYGLPPAEPLHQNRDYSSLVSAVIHPSLSHFKRT